MEPLERSDNELALLLRQARSPHRNCTGRYYSKTHRFAVEKISVIAGALDRVADGVPEVQQRPLAGRLAFVGRNDGRLTALDSSNGKKLWEFQTGAGMNATASVFAHAGKQYVVAYSGGSVFARSAKGDSVWLFALDGTLDAVPAGKQ